MLSKPRALWYGSSRKNSPTRPASRAPCLPCKATSDFAVVVFFQRKFQLLRVFRQLCAIQFVLHQRRLQMLFKCHCHFQNLLSSPVSSIRSHICANLETIRLPVTFGNFSSFCLYVFFGWFSLQANFPSSKLLVTITGFSALYR